MRLVVKAERSHVAYSRVRNGKIELIAPKGTPKLVAKKEVQAYKLQRKIMRRQAGHGHQVKLTPAELKAVLDSGKFALVSAGKSPHDHHGFSDKEAKKRHKILRANLISAGYCYTQVEGHYGGKEDSFLVMVHDADRQDMLDLGTALKQDSIIFGNAGRYSCYFTYGSHIGKVVNASSWELKPDASDFYTSYPHPDGTKTKFSLNLDFDHIVEIDEKAAALSLPDLMKSTTHEVFYETVMTVPGKIKKIDDGRFGAREVKFQNGMRAVLKPQLFSNQKFRGIARNEQYRREAAAYQLDRQVLHFGLVPPTTLTVYKTSPASVQAWAVGLHARKIAPGVFDRSKDDWKETLALFSAKVNIDQIRKLIIFDLIANNTDRHAKNCLFDPFTKRVWAIDNGCAFGRYFQHYNNVFHRWLFRHHLELSERERASLSEVTLDQLTTALQRYLPKRDIEETFWRIQWVLEQEDLGYEKLAPESTSKNDFPSNKAWFVAKTRKGNPNRVVAEAERMGLPAIA